MVQVRVLRDVFICYEVVSYVADGDIAKLMCTYERALIFLLLRLRRRTRFFLHLALILNEFAAGRLARVSWRGRRHQCAAAAPVHEASMAEANA